MKKRNRVRWIHQPMKEQNKTVLRELVVSSLPIKDDPAQPILRYAKREGLPGPGRGDMHRYHYHRKVVDITTEVHRMLKRGLLKRERRYGFGHSGKAGHTYFVATEKLKSL